MGLALLFVIACYIILSAIIIGLTYTFTSSTKPAKIVALILLVFPFWRVIFFETIFLFYRLTPLQEIHETVPKPLSVYWEDNIWPGHNMISRSWMIKNYLDGVHLQTLAMNGDDGKIYLYQANSETFSVSNKLRLVLERKKNDIAALELEAITLGKSGGDNKGLWKRIRAMKKDLNKGVGEIFKQQYNTEIDGIMKHAQVFSSKSKLPDMNYTVIFKPIESLLSPLHDLIHADKITIVDNRQNKVIAFSKRYLAYAGFISKFSGKQPMFDHRVGDLWAYEFDNKVLFNYSTIRDECHSSELNNWPNAKK